MLPKYSNTIIINAAPAMVWKHLSNLELMKKWMAEPEMKLEIQTDWKVGNPIVIKGFHHAPFENRGIVLAFEPNKILRYTHLSSLSHVKNTDENYVELIFRLEEINNETKLTLELDFSHTPSIEAGTIIYKHMLFYWSNTMIILSNTIEKDEK